jgi:hypothetical protein
MDPSRLLGAALAIAAAARLVAAADVPAGPAAEAGAGEQAAAPEVHWERERLTVRASRVPLRALVDAIAARAGGGVEGELTAPRDVSVSFDQLPLDDGLRRVLDDQSFALVYARDGTLRRVVLLPPGQAPVASPPAPVRPSSAARAADRSPGGALGRVLDDHLPVAVSGRLAGAVNSDGASLRQLARLALTHEDPGIRADASQVLLGTVEAEAALRAALQSALEQQDDAALRAFLATGSPERVAEAIAYVESHARSGETRQGAARLRRLLAPGG